MGVKREDVLSAWRDSCSLPIALELIGERWCFMILRTALVGVAHFEDFLSATGIARNILSNRLARLVEAGIMTRTPCSHDRRKVEYRLTEKGLDLLPTMIALREWGEKWQTGVQSDPVLCDERDRQPIQPIKITAHDGRELTIHDLCWMYAKELAKGADSDGDSSEPLVRNLHDISVNG